MKRETTTDAQPQPPGAEIDAGTEASRRGFMARLRGALVVPAIEFVDWEAVEESLIAGDVGPLLASEAVADARRRLESRQARTGVEAVRGALEGRLPPGEPAWEPSPATPGGPAILLIVGVNGTGKTTTIAKLALRERARGRRVLLAAADTFRAAAIDQLRTWAERTGSEIVSHAPGADPGAVVYDALDAALARGIDTLIVDTAGRLHTKTHLMDELAKIRRVIERRLPGAMPETLFVLDATTGQNGLAQARAFHESVGLSGIVLTKLDSTARGGIVFAIADAVGVPVRYVGVGERATDLVPFDPRAFVEALFGAAS
ncbi:MAG: signal recognition particle-docking protein FtsY [Chloroflexi bacterium]|nr:signal recognition particle-docking protein FtsY [Chloroflexota bacterium]